jgi:hypothetical protein
MEIPMTKAQSKVKRNEANKPAPKKGIVPNGCGQANWLSYARENDNKNIIRS